MPKKNLDRAQIRGMNRKFWIVLSIGILILLVLTLVDLHYLDLTYFEPR